MDSTRPFQLASNSNTKKENPFSEGKNENLIEDSEYDESGIKAKTDFSTGGTKTIQLLPIGWGGGGRGGMKKQHQRNDTFNYQTVVRRGRQKNNKFGGVVMGGHNEFSCVTVYTTKVKDLWN